MHISIHFIFIGSLVAVAAPAIADDGKLKATLEARYDEMKLAMANRDVESISALLTPGFVSEDVSGRRERKDEMLHELEGLPKDPKKSSETTVVSVERIGDTAVVAQRYHMTTQKQNLDGSIQNVELVTSSRDIWVVASGKWLIQSTTTDQVDYKINGALVIHKQREARH